MLTDPPVVLMAVWALLIVALMFFRPRPHEVLFWILVVPIMLTGGGYMVLSRREEKHEESGVAAWNSRLAALVDVHDFENDGHLHEYFNEAERKRVIFELEQMPAGSRSLRKSIGLVNPALLEEKA